MGIQCLLFLIINTSLTVPSFFLVSWIVHNILSNLCSTDLICILVYHFFLNISYFSYKDFTSQLCLNLFSCCILLNGILVANFLMCKNKFNIIFILIKIQLHNLPCFSSFQFFPFYPSQIYTYVPMYYTYTPLCVCLSVCVYNQSSMFNIAFVYVISELITWYWIIRLEDLPLRSTSCSCLAVTSYWKLLLIFHLNKFLGIFRRHNPLLTLTIFCPLFHDVLLASGKWGVLQFYPFELETPLSADLFILTCYGFL